MSSTETSPRVVELASFRNGTAPPRTAEPPQVYPQFVQAKGPGRYDTFTFPFPPVAVQHSNLVPEWVEVDRPGYVPIVGLKKYNLMRLQFDFLLAAPWDGIKYPVEDELLLLRRMANRTEPIYFTGMGTFLNTPLSLPGATSRAGMFFRITDFSINSMRRNPNQEVTAAQCSMALQEDYVLNIRAVTMPAIQYPAILKPRTVAGPSSTPTSSTRCAVSEGLNGFCTVSDGTKVFLPGSSFINTGTVASVND